MRLRPSLLFLLPCWVAACAGAGEDANVGEEDELRFRAGPVDTTLPDVDALGYEIDLVVDPAPGKETFRAEVKGTYVATRALTELTLDLDGNTIDDVKVSGRTAAHTRSKDRLTIKLPERVASGATFSTRIAYHGAVTQADGADPNDFAAFGGFMVKQRNTDKKRIFTSLSWPSKARRWLPLRDHPRDTAMVAITATFPKSFTVLANGKRLDTKEEGSTRTWRYEALAPMPTYDFHVAAYEDWKTEEARTASGVPVTSHTYASEAKKTKTIYGDVPRALDFFEKAFGKYRWETLSYIQEPIFGGGMEHASVISMDETLFPDPREARTTAFHELAHHWSGNSVHFRTWNDFWLSEGFTEYLTARAITELDGPDAGRHVWRDYLTNTLDADKTTPHALAPRGAEIDVLTIFDSIPYQKGALTVRLLERVAGDKWPAFIRGWFDRHGLGAAVTTDDLQRELGDAIGKDLGPLFATVVREPGHPELRVTSREVAGETEIKVEQLQESGPRGGFRFPLDVDLVTERGTERVVVDLDGKTTTKRVRPKAKVTSLVVDPDEFAVAVLSCGQSGGDCKDGFRCAPQRPDVSMCVPRPEPLRPRR